jgi:hypothetical protein
VTNGRKGAKAPYSELSDLRCGAGAPARSSAPGFEPQVRRVVACERRIKINVALRKRTRPLLCYACYMRGERARRTRSET